MTAPSPLRGRRVLVAEDEWLLAVEIRRLLEGQGCEIVGPFATLPRALAALEAERPEAAVIDLNLKGEHALPLAEALRDRALPFVIVTGYGGGQETMARLPDVPRLGKPIDHRKLLRTLARAVAGR